MTEAREREERPRWPAPGPAGGDAPAAALFATLHLQKLKSPAAPVGPSGIGDYSSSESYSSDDQSSLDRLPSQRSESGTVSR